MSDALDSPLVPPALRDALRLSPQTQAFLCGPPGFMAEVSGMKLVGDRHPDLGEPLPPGILLYEINGPLFFGAAGKAMDTISNSAQKLSVAILDMSNVPAMDVTGLVALESALGKLKARGVRVIIGGLNHQPRKVFEKAGLEEVAGQLQFCAGLEQAIAEARKAALAAS